MIGIPFLVLYVKLGVSTKWGMFMTMMELLNLLQKEVPLCTISKQDANVRSDYLKKTLKFLQIVEDSELLKPAEIKTLKRIRNKINDIWINYLYGRVNTASSQMQNLLTLSVGKCQYIDIFNTALTKAFHKLYRGRISSTPLDKVEDFYHIPFNKRYLIGNQRYSLSGIPCFYLASDPACVYEELGSKKDVHLCELYTKKDIQIFDMSIDYESWIQEKISKEKLIHLLYRMPLEYACSFQAEDNEGAAFKTNYIIPQLVTATLYNMNTKISCIRYSSIKARDLPHIQRLNYVFLPEYRIGKDIYDFNLISSFTIQLIN